jgi:formiminoglutamase
MAPLIVTFPHTGTRTPDGIARELNASWLARKDTDWHVRQLYDFAGGLDATMVATEISRTVIDVNRDPSGASLYPGQATTALCPLTSFDGEALYRTGREPGAGEIARRKRLYFAPYHRALTEEIGRLCAKFGQVVLYDAHAIRSTIPRLFEGVLPHFNIGTNGGRSCAPRLAQSLAAICARSEFSTVTDGRFRGGWTTRHHGNPAAGVHAVQMELAFRTYLDEPAGAIGPATWPADFSAVRAAKAREILSAVLNACLDFANP